jgi:L,D-transpeptidase ErfK/SrfK
MTVRPVISFLYLVTFLLMTAPPTYAVILSRAEGYIGELRQYRVKDRESLIEIARRFDLGFNEIADANPGVDPFLPKTGSVVTIPTVWIPPAAPPRPAIVINIPELRLYYFPKGSGTVSTYPLGIGDQGTDTPIGRYRVVEKIVRPAWHVPKSIRQQRRLPEVVPPGPNNPMGSHALRLSMQSILIHGTNRPWGIGRRSSHGCLRLYPEDIVQLYRKVPTGTRVVIVNQPVKLAVKGKNIYLEVHRYERVDLSVGRALHMLAQRKLVGRVDFAKVIGAIKERKGYPVDVTLVVEALKPQPRERQPSIIDWLRNPVLPLSW